MRVTKSVDVGEVYMDVGNIDVEVEITEEDVVDFLNDLEAVDAYSLLNDLDLGGYLALPKLVSLADEYKFKAVLELYKVGDIKEIEDFIKQIKMKG